MGVVQPLVFLRRHLCSLSSVSLTVGHVIVQQSLFPETMQTVAAIEFLVVMLTIVHQTVEIFNPTIV